MLGGHGGHPADTLLATSTELLLLMLAPDNTKALSITNTAHCISFIGIKFPPSEKQRLRWRFNDRPLASATRRCGDAAASRLCAPWAGRDGARGVLPKPRAYARALASKRDRVCRLSRSCAGGALARGGGLALS